MPDSTGPTKAPDRSAKLLELAKARFGDELTDADRKLFWATANGKFAIYGDRKLPPEDPDPRRTLNADRIHWLCTDAKAVKEILPHEGVKIAEAHIQGSLRLDFVSADYSIALINCSIPDEISLCRAHLASLFMDGSHTGPINADRLIVDHNVHLSDKFEANGEVRLVGANIGGDLVCVGGHFSKPDGSPLNADGIQVRGGVFLRDKFKAKGEVRLIGANIGGTLECDGAHFSNPDGDALYAEGIQVGGSVFLRNGFKAKGGVLLRGANIGRELGCGEAHFSNPNGAALNAERIQVRESVFLRSRFEGEVRLTNANIGNNLECDGAHFSNPDGDALHADAIMVGGCVFLRTQPETQETAQPFTAEGTVRLLAAKIANNLECDGAHFTNSDDIALGADGIQVGHSVFLRNGFEAKGVVRLPGASIGGDLECSGAHFSNGSSGKEVLSANQIKVAGSVFFRDGFSVIGTVNLSTAWINGEFQWHGISDRDKCDLLDLESAEARTLWDEETSWPDKLALDNFVYKRLDRKSELDPQKRVTNWVRRSNSPEFLPQPYEQLANVLKEMGHTESARQVLIEREKDPKKLKAMTWPQWLWHKLLGATIGYGYRPWRALGWMLMFFLIGWVVFCHTASNNQMLPLKDGELPAFNAAIYSLDTFVPLVDLRQASYRLPKPWWAYGYLWLHISCGWGLTTLLVVGLTGLIKK